jgi:peptide/nickel transport system ATP-binding protein
MQLQILTLIRELKKDYGTTIQYITHDLGVVAEMCDRVAVMYAGNVVKLSDVIEIFKNPLHPYTRALLECIPRPGTEFKSIEGFIPSLINPPSGCRFHPRCTNAMEVCKVQEPQLSDVGNGHLVACHLFTK